MGEIMYGIPDDIDRVSHMLEDFYLAHYGKGHLDGGHSGRYQWGSGENPYQRNAEFLKTVKQLKNEGLTEKEIADHFGFKNTTDLRNHVSAAVNANKKTNFDTLNKMIEEEPNVSLTELGRRFGVSDNTIKSWLNQRTQARVNQLSDTVDILRKAVDERKFIDIGVGAEFQVGADGVSRDKFKKAIAQLEDEGYTTHLVDVKQMSGSGQYTTVMVLAPPGTDLKTVRANQHKISQIKEREPLGEEARTAANIVYPSSVDSKRVKIRYAEEGGTALDGTIEIRRGVKDLDLGDSHYAQVRIMVDGTHYLKGMARYSDGKDMPDGVDIIYNSNKKLGTPAGKVFKEIKEDPSNPFGSSIKAQSTYIDDDGKEQLSPINIVTREGDWGKWKKTLSPQMLSKQTITLARQQLTERYNEARTELNEIMAVPNHAVRKALLQEFADNCDGNAISLKAASMPRQQSHVILPINSLKPNEIYAPNYEDGETVVLIRYPHGGRFEIPQLTVNNRNKEGRSVIGNAPDAVGIHHSAAEQLSGADFDGDTVLVIPNNRGQVKVKAPLEGLQGFDPKMYKLPDDAPESMKMKKKYQQKQMGVTTNLITDMTIHEAPPEDIAAAVRHSMVVIDAVKHGLDYRQSYIDNNIAELNRKYQGKASGGAATLISLAGSETRVPQRKMGYRIDKETGERIFTETGRSYAKVNRDGSVSYVQYESKITRMDKAKDARELSSGTPMEELYASFANNMKALANQARKNLMDTPTVPRNSEAAKQYEAEVSSLNRKLNDALMNAPYEREAQIIANHLYRDRLNNDSSISTDEDKKKAKTQALAAARYQVGAKKPQIVISDSEWEAIQAGAVSGTKADQIMQHADSKRLKELATPRTAETVTVSDANKIRNLSRNGYTTKEIAEFLGKSVSSVQKALSD